MIELNEWVLRCIGCVGVLPFKKLILCERMLYTLGFGWFPCALVKLVQRFFVLIETHGRLLLVKKVRTWASPWRQTHYPHG